MPIETPSNLPRYDVNQTASTQLNFDGRSTSTPVNHPLIGDAHLSSSPVSANTSNATSLPTFDATLALMNKQPKHLQASKENLTNLAEMSYLNTLRTLEKLALRGDDNSSNKNKLIEKICAARDDLKGKLQGDGLASKSDIKACKNFAKNTSKLITDTYKKSFGPEFKKLKIGGLIKEQLRIDYATQLGKTEKLWQPISNSINFSKEEMDLNSTPASFFKLISREYQSNMVPAAKLAGLSGNYQKNGVHGVSSMSTQETRHAVNLWTTEFTGSDVAFKGVRHGVNFPFGEENLEKQIKGADQRTFEVITAAADVKREAILAHLKKHGDSKPFPLSIVSSSLLTPTEGLKYKKFELGQQDAWTRAEDMSKSKTLAVQVKDSDGQLQSVKLKLEVLPFSFGVNGVAKLASSAPTALKLLDKLPNVDVTGWKWADEHNQPLLDSLCNKGHSFIQFTAEADTSDFRQKERIQHYVSDIREIVSSGKHHKDEGNAYALPILVSLLSNELGLVPAWNCMSGKDRTGYLDAKIKETLVRQDLVRGQAVSQFGKVTDESAKLLERMLLETGNLDIQEACTGVAGYKVNEGVKKLMGKEIDLSVKSNRENLRAAARPILEGLSGGVKA